MAPDDRDAAADDPPRAEDATSTADGPSPAEADSPPDDFDAPDDPGADVDPDTDGADAGDHDGLRPRSVLDAALDDSADDVDLDREVPERPSPNRSDRRRVFRYVALVAALALVVRLVGLGTRIFHWDEGRVGYWILRYHETGVFSYRPIVHGPFLPVVNDYLFVVAPATDFTARLPVAVVGGLLPLVAWLFREHLRDEEVVALALVLAANPLLVYYSRFMRNDVLVAAFATAALGFAVRYVDTRDLRYAYPAAGAMALAFTTKENALLYLACFLGAGVLLLDHRLVRDTASGRSVRAVLFGDWPLTVADRVRAHGASFEEGARRVGVHLLGATLVFLAVVVFFYAPRPDLWTALGDPGAIPGLLENSTVAPAERFYDTWAGGSHQDHDYLPFLHDELETLAYGAPGVVAFGVVGVVVDRFTGNRRFSPLVAFATYWGLASVVGYPIATDIEAPWAAVHSVVPFAFPAAVGVGFVYRSLRASLAVEDGVSVGLAALLLLAAAGGAVGANAAYMDSTEEADKAVLQWAQPATDLKTTLDDVRAVARSHEGTDVLFYGTRDPNRPENVLFHVEDESSLARAPPGGPSWHSRLPLPWYLERYDASVTSSSPDADVAEVTADAPPVVIAYSWDRAELEPRLDGYVAREHRFKLWGENVVVFIDRAALESARSPTAASG